MSGKSLTLMTKKRASKSGMSVDHIQKMMLAKSRAREKRSVLLYRMEQLIDNALDIEARLSVGETVVAAEIRFIQNLDRLLTGEGKET